MLDQLYSQKTIPKGQIRPAVHNGQNNTDPRSAHTSTPFPQSQNVQIQKASLSQEAVPENPFKGELIKTSTPDSNKKLAAETTTQQQNINEKDQSFGFFDFLDVINPLQHIPVISTLYREITGDEIQPAARVVGGMIYGGPSGFISAIANSISEETTGKDIGENILEAFIGSDEEEIPVQVAAANPLSENTPSPLFSQLAPVIPPAPSPTSGSQTQINNALNTSASPSPLEGKAALAALYDDITSTTTHSIQASSNLPSNSNLTIQQTASEPLLPSKPGKWFPLSGNNVLIAQASHSPQPIPTKVRTQQITPAITASATDNMPSAEETIAAIESDFATNLLNGLDKYQELKSNN